MIQKPNLESESTMALANTINVLENSTEKCTLLTPECPANFQYSCTSMDGLKAGIFFPQIVVVKIAETAGGQPWVATRTAPAGLWLLGSGHRAERRRARTGCGPRPCEEYALRSIPQFWAGMCIAARGSGERRPTDSSHGASEVAMQRAPHAQAAIA